MPDVDWNRELVDQLDWHFARQSRPRLDGLTDQEYFWEPVPGWTVRRKDASTSPEAPGSGEFTIDFSYPEPVPPPVTTIAWRLGHILIGVLGTRTAAHFGGPAVDYQSFDYPGTASEALARLDAAALVLHINREMIHHLAEIALLRDLYAHGKLLPGGHP